MKLKHITPILNVSNISASLAWFENLGWNRCWTYNDGGMIEGAAGENADGPAGFAAVGCGECEIFLCRNGQGARDGRLPQQAGDDNTGGVWMSWWLPTPADVNALHELALKHSATVTWPPTDEPWGVREFHLQHPDGHTFRVSAPLECEPPLASNSD